ncbi:MAG: trypsin-like serine protease [Chloroflexota bacterium]
MPSRRRLPAAAVAVAGSILAVVIGWRLMAAPVPVPNLPAAGGGVWAANVSGAWGQPGAAPNAAGRRTPAAEPAIIGGAPVPSGTYRFMTFLTRDGGQLCGGALITPNHVLTAAHCMAGGATASSLMAYIGGNVKSGGIPQGGLTRTVSQIAVHPLWNPVTRDYDAAVLTLGQAVPPAAGGGVDPLPLTGSGSSLGLAPGTSLTVAGWGQTSLTPPAYPSQLMAVNVPVQANPACAANGPAYNPDTMFCAGPLAGGQDSCFGDSGGPIFLNSGGVLTEIGIVSWGQQCALPNLPGVYAKIANPLIHSFIMTAIGAPIPTPTPVPDTTGPTVSIQQPGKGDTVSAPFTVKVRASDPSGVRKVELERCVRNACQRVGTDSSAPYSFRVDAPKGKVTLRATATDQLGNSRKSKKVAVTVK